ncbi:hypothetical protein GPJ56_001247 [Histomonas meleagridis]|uniref:uncharacterized protein n=1 Tax=Histomonas meleagridis TaxID=135588 RepID=UPI003559C968|nr:hypothetical protein GPJ56_001247 [Histomonas meleagridis]KAH0797623.1 hypothetical protein GO595_009252 [Histomonas meleagridis]
MILCCGFLRSLARSMESSDGSGQQQQQHSSLVHLKYGVWQQQDGFPQHRQFSPGTQQDSGQQQNCHIWQYQRLSTKFPSMQGQGSHLLLLGHTR